MSPTIVIVYICIHFKQGNFLIWVLVEDYFYSDNLTHSKALKALNSAFYTPIESAHAKLPARLIDLFSAVVVTSEPL